MSETIGEILLVSAISIFATTLGMFVIIIKDAARRP